MTHRKLTILATYALAALVALPANAQAAHGSFHRTLKVSTAEVDLGRQFKRHTVVRRYLAVVPGEVAAQTIRSRLVRDRGDGRRGSTSVSGPSAMHPYYCTAAGE